MSTTTERPVLARLPLWAPLKVSVAWLAGTYLLFLVVGDVHKVPSLWRLSVFVAVTTGAFVCGYAWKAISYRSVEAPAATVDAPKRIGQIKAATTASALYFAAYGIALLAEYGVASPSAILAALQNPGDAYLAKFDVYARQEAFGTTNLAVQVLTLLAVLSTPLVPFVVVYLRHLTGDIRLLAGVGLGLYVLYFLSIGTMSGLGNVLIFAVVAAMVTRARGMRATGRKRRRITAMVVLGTLVFVGYMTYSQAGRLDAIGMTSDYEPNPIAARLVGDDLARGVTIVAMYPTHGYQGLAYDLDTPFKWTRLRGSSVALDSYLDQYGFGESVYDETYPRRTEFRTGWPAGQVWSTIYPWLASDLSFYGVPFFMAFVGWWLARFWYESVVLHSRLALLLLCQLGLLIAFVPANNQIGIGRPSLIAFASLIGLYAVSRFRSRADHRGMSSSAARPLLSDQA